MSHRYYSQRTGVHPHPHGLPLSDVLGLFVRVYEQLVQEGYFTEAFGFHCVDAGYMPGKVPDPELEILLLVRKRDLWPIDELWKNYSEADFFDLLEFLFQKVSKPIKGTHHSYNDCGMHWATFDAAKGRVTYRGRINDVLAHYERRFALSVNGEILAEADHGFEQLFRAEVPTTEKNVSERIDAAILKFRRHGASLDDRRGAVRDLADVLEYLRPKMKGVITDKDEGDLFTIANNFGIRHHNERQRTGYDAAIWLSWIFYHYLSTIHVVLRRTKSKEACSGQTVSDSAT